MRTVEQALLCYVKVQAKRRREVLALDVVLACRAGAVAEAPALPHEKFNDVSSAVRAVDDDVLSSTTFSPPLLRAAFRAAWLALSDELEVGFPDDPRAPEARSGQPPLRLCVD